MYNRTDEHDNPFRFGALALDEAFTDREREIAELRTDVLNGQDVVVFAPRRFGKSSLIWRVAASSWSGGARRPLRPDDGADEGAVRREAREDDPRGRRLAAVPRPRARARRLPGPRVIAAHHGRPERRQPQLRLRRRQSPGRHRRDVERLLQLPGELAADAEAAGRARPRRVPGDRVDRPATTPA